MQLHPWIRVLRQLQQPTREGACVVRPGGPDRWMWLVIVLHAAFIGTVVLWPVIMRNDRDAIFLLAVAAIVMQWAAFRGECLVSLLEKRLLYVDYRMGDAPLRQWYDELMPAPVATGVGVAVWTAMTAAFLTVLYRNVSGSLPMQCLRLELTWPVTPAP